MIWKQINFQIHVKTNFYFFRQIELKIVSSCFIIFNSIYSWIKRWVITITITRKVLLKKLLHWEVQLAKERITLPFYIIDTENQEIQNLRVIGMLFVSILNHEAWVRFFVLFGNEKRFFSLIFWCNFDGYCMIKKKNSFQNFLRLEFKLNVLFTFNDLFLKINDSIFRFVFKKPLFYFYFLFYFHWFHFSF